METERGSGNIVTQRRNDEIAAAHDDLAPPPRLSGIGNGIGKRNWKRKQEVELENGINRFLHGKTKIEIIFQSLYARKNEIQAENIFAEQQRRAICTEKRKTK